MCDRGIERKQRHDDQRDEGDRKVWLLHDHEAEEDGHRADQQCVEPAAKLERLGNARAETGGST